MRFCTVSPYVIHLKEAFKKGDNKQNSPPISKTLFVTTYESQVHFGTRVQVWVRVRVRDSVIFEKDGCGYGGTRRLKNY